MNKKNINILLVEDDKSHAALISRSFESAPGPVSMTVTYNLNEARSSIAKSTPDLIITDFLLPDGKGTALIPDKKEDPPYPVIILTSHGDENIAVEAMKTGAFDYVVKSEVTMDDMPRICERVMREWQHITERKQLQKRLNAQHAITEVLVESNSLNDASSKIIRNICEALEWDLGEIWTYDQQAGILRNTEIWHMSSLKVEEFKAATKIITFPAKIGLPGRVFEKAVPLWIEDVVYDTNFLRASIADREGLHSAFGFPIMIGSEVLGTFCFYSREIRRPDKELLDMMKAIGSQIGLLIKRKEAEKEISANAERFNRWKSSNFVGVIQSNASGGIDDVNDALLAMLGYSRQDFIEGCLDWTDPAGVSAP